MSCECKSPAPCGCCEGPRILTPRTTGNRPGLNAISVRVGTHGSFIETMKARLASQDFPALRDLTTRATDDPAIAILDAWAIAADVLTFYTERIANEGYLRTATERRSVLELARLIGYRPRPGVAASVFLAFTLDTGATLEILAGQPARSVPAPGTSDLPQTFETSHPLKARAELNRLRPRMSVPQEITPENVMNLDTIWFVGIALNLKPNDLLVVSFSSDTDSLVLRSIESISIDQDNKRTAVSLRLERLSVPFFLRQIRSALGALKTSAVFDFGVAPDDQPLRDAADDIKDFADELLPTLTGDRKLTELDGLVGTALKEAHCAKTNMKFEALAADIDRISQQANDLIAKSVDAQRKSESARVSFVESVQRKSQAFLKVADLVQPLFDAVNAATASSPALLDLADRVVRDVSSDFEALAQAIRNFRNDATGDFATAKTNFMTFAPFAGTDQVTVPAVLQTLIAYSGATLEGPVASIFGAALASGTKTLSEIRQSALTTAAGFGERLQDLLDLIQNAFGTFVSALTGIPALDATLAGPTDLPPVKQIVDARTSYESARVKILALDPTDPTKSAKDFDQASPDLVQPKIEAAIFTGVIGLNVAIQSLRDKVVALRVALIDRVKSIAGRYAFLATGDSGSRTVDASLKKLATDFEHARSTLDATKPLGDPTQLDNLQKQIGPAPGTPIAVITGILGSTLPPLLLTLRRLQAELRGLIDQVTTAPIVADAPAVNVTSLGGGLTDLREEIRKRLVPAPDNPLSIPADADKSFSADESHASDMVARTVAKLSAVSDDDVFAVWRQFRSGKLDTKVFVMRQKTAVFGNNAARGEDFGSGASPNPDARFAQPEGKTDWTLRQGDIGTTIALESEFPKIIDGSFIAIQRPGEEPVPYRIKSVQSGPRSVYGITGKSTVAELDGSVEWGKGYKPPPYSATAPELNQGFSPFQIPQFFPSGLTVPPSVLSGPPKLLPLFDLIRRTVVFAQSEELNFAEKPVDRSVGPEVSGGVDTDSLGESATTIMLDGLYQGIDSGRWLVVAGDRADGISGARVSEPAVVTRVEHVLLSSIREDDDQSPRLPRPGDTPHTRIVLSKPLTFSYVRETIEIFGNVIDATAGETRAETLGNGDARLEFQRFDLKQPPVTFTAAPTVSGSESTLAVRVSDVLWHEVESFDALGPTGRNYVTETDDDGKTRVIFGNGREGARLPTGLANVTAGYRNGIGKPGNVKAGAISQLTTKPLGLKEVINPLRASGGADRDTREQIRRNAPLATLALERLVSVRDYQDFTQTFAGIGKASATRLSDGNGHFVHVTIAGLDDIPIDPTSDLVKSLMASLLRAGDPHLRLCVQPRELVLLVLVAGVRVNPDYLWEKVEPKLRTALLEAFGFERRDLGQSVAASEVLAVMQTIEGVDYVDVDAFGGIPERQTNKDGSGSRVPLSPDEIANRVGKMKSDPWVPAALAGYEPPPADPLELMPVAAQAALRAAQLAIFSPEVRDTLILKEIKA